MCGDGAGHCLPGTRKSGAGPDAGGPQECRHIGRAHGVVSGSTRGRRGNGFGPRSGVAHRGRLGDRVSNILLFSMGASCQNDRPAGRASFFKQGARKYIRLVRVGLSSGNRRSTRFHQGRPAGAYQCSFGG